MMKTPIILVSVALAALTLGLPQNAYAQTPTDQTDQSEEDWRQSRKKRGTSDIYRTPNRSSTGVGAPIVDVKPISPVEQLPAESRRHVMRERAKAIAESPDGDISNASYEPSDAALSDEQLMRAEQRAWEHVTQSGSGAEPADADQAQATDAAGGGSGSASPADQSAEASPQGSAGSSASLQQIMDAIKSGEVGHSAPSEAQSDAQGQDEAQGQADASASAQASDDSASDGGGQSNDGGQSGAAGASGETSQNELLSPLELIRQSRAERPAEGKKRSASDYLGKPPQR